MELGERCCIAGCAFQVSHLYFVHSIFTEVDGTWIGSNTNAWELSNDDFTAWDNFLEYAINKALDYGVDSFAVLDHVASTISRNPNPAFTDSARVADLLLKYLEISDARQIPAALFEFVNDTLLSTYPPEPRNKITSSWLLRSLTRVVDACSAELVLSLFEIIQDGLSVWVSDSYSIFTLDEYEYEVIFLIIRLIRIG